MANLPTRNNNPGNIRGTGGAFEQHSSSLEGQAALYNDLTSKLSGDSSHKIPDGPHAGQPLTPQSSLLDMIRVYAPTKDHNSPLSYAADVATQLGISPDTPIGALLPHIDQLARAMANHEGYKGQWAGSSDTKIDLDSSSGPTDSSGINNLGDTPNYPGSGLDNLPQTQGDSDSEGGDDELAPEKSSIRQQFRNSATGLIQGQPYVFGLPSGLATTQRLINGEIDQDVNTANQDMPQQQEAIKRLHEMALNGTPKDDPKRLKLAGLLRTGQNLPSPTNAQIDPGVNVTPKQVGTSSALTVGAILGIPKLIEKAPSLLKSGSSNSGGLVNKAVGIAKKGVTLLGIAQALKHTPAKGLVSVLGHLFGD